MHPPSDPLDPLLERWRQATPELAESVAPEVWRRIAHMEDATPATSSGWWRIEAAFARPAFAVAFVAACVVFGLFLAEVRLSRLQAERTARLESNYLQLIDPLLTASQPSSARMHQAGLRP